MFFYSRTLYTGWSLDEVNTILDILVANGIRYKLKVSNHSAELLGHNTPRGMGGDFQNNPYERQYDILIKEKDFANAEFYLHNKNREEVTRNK